MLNGLMMQAPLAIASLIQHAERFHPDVEIVSRRVEGDIHRSTYRQAHRRARQLANALTALGVGRSDRVGTLAWNGYRHFELYFAVSGSGAVLHTLNPRLHADQIAWIVNHAGDKVLCFDLTFLPIVEAIAAHCPGVEHWVAMIDRDRMPKAAQVPLHCYEALIDGHSERFAWPEFDENLASSMCYTSGTTGNPKGVLYSHRSTLLHSYAAALPDALNLSSRDAILPVVPMFHVNAWGMTEMSPLGTVASLKAKHLGQSAEERLPVQYKQGRPIFGVDMKIVGDDGQDLPWDGKAFGDLWVRGPWVVREYFKGEGGDPLQHDAAGTGWFPTGDVATIDADGYMQITDRSKDVIKSGGEWISSIEIENIAVSHPAVAMAACIAIKHPKWDERPLLVVVRKPDAQLSAEEMLRHYEGKLAKWQIPDAVAFVESIPLGATGKMLKARLREQFRDYRLAGT